MKRILKQLLLLLLIISSLVSCSEYRPPVSPGGGNDSDNESSGGGSTEGGEGAFTVSIRYNGEQYIPKASAKMKARWTDGFSAYVADFGEDGKASTTGLDGDYQVTLENLPEGILPTRRQLLAKHKGGTKQDG